MVGMPYLSVICLIISAFDGCWSWAKVRFRATKKARLALAGEEKFAASTSPALAPGGRAEHQRGGIADGRVAEFLPLDIGLGIAALLEGRFKDGARGFAGGIHGYAEDVRTKFSRERAIGRLRLDVVGVRCCGQEGRTNDKHHNQGAANHESPAKPDEQQWSGIRQILNHHA